MLNLFCLCVCASPILYHLEKASFTQHHRRRQWKLDENMYVWHFQELKFFSRSFLLLDTCDLNLTTIGPQFKSYIRFFLYRKKEATHKDKNNGQWNLQQQKKKSWKYFTTKRYINEITIYISRCWCSIAICSIRTLSSTGCWWWNSWRCWYSRCWLLITIIRWKLKIKRIVL